MSLDMFCYSNKMQHKKYGILEYGIHKIKIFKIFKFLKFIYDVLLLATRTAAFGCLGSKIK